ncbi:MAG: diphthamide synthesis protein [Nanoarchaeota archaeon]
MKYDIRNLNEIYNLELDEVVKKIKSEKAKIVLLQFPDGLKPFSTTIVDYLDEKTQGKTEFIIWLGSCYGACDLPILGKDIKKKIDLVFQFGHSELMPSF